MEELGEFNDEEFVKKQEELRKQQAIFEYQEKVLEEVSPEVEKKERKKDLILSWAILGLMILFVLFLSWKLLL